MTSEQTPDPRAHPVAILDFGSQYTMLIARRVRGLRVYCEIFPPDVSAATLRQLGVPAVILSGGPGSVYEADAPKPDPGIFELGVPVLGICYGMYLLAEALGARVERGPLGEYGSGRVELLDTSQLFQGLSSPQAVWMSHGDCVTAVPEGVRVTARSEGLPVAALEAPDRRLYAVQFHPEVAHTAHGEEVLENFLFSIAGCLPRWRMGVFSEETVRYIAAKAAGERVLCAVSGGVDSTVTAVLVHRAIGDRLTSILVDTGLLRLGEAEEARHLFQDALGINLEVVNAADTFLAKLRGVTDPEEKRRRIGRTFIEVFEREAKTRGRHRFLAQGTLYPDVIESVSYRGPSAVIKTHHNVGGLPERMELDLIEPLRELFKDEVREVAAELGIPERLSGRHPFPGPGLAVRIPGEVTEEGLETLRSADRIFEEELRASGEYSRVAQAFAVLLPVHSVGVMGDRRTYERVVALRAVTSKDFMTADWARLPADLLARVSNRIVSEVRGANRVVYDVSSKPPATVEWE